jgi:hypothetical protein
MASMCILIVEDEVMLTKDIQQTLMRLGYEVPAIAISGTAAFEEYPAF